MSKKANLVVFSILLGIAIMSIGAWAETPKKVATYVDEKEDYPSPDEFIRVERQPEMIHEEVPVYPEKAKKDEAEAIVWIKSLVNKDGEVVKSMIFKSSDSEYSFDKTALDAAYKCKFKPAVKDGKPVAVWITYCVKFTLTKEKSEEQAPDKDIKE